VNDLVSLLRAVDLLAAHGLTVWVAGGWGEELRGLCPPRDHRDVDLLLPAPSFARLDELEVEWVAAKRFAWKRAFMLDGAMIELLLVQHDARGWYTSVRGRRHDWPGDVFAHAGRLRVASARALTGYRAAHSSLAA
jgi:aminoglycoside-2''-adenylyltransferase